MRLEELRPGDILLFAGTEGHPLGEAIMWLTDSPISHAALVDEDSTFLIDAVPPQVRRVEVAEAVGTERKVWVRRLKRRPDSMEPVIDSARKHLNAETDYAESNLVLLAGLMLHRKLPFSGRLQNASLKFFRRVTRRFSEGLHGLIEGGQGKSMVCSEFVYVCHEQAGDRYRLRLDDHLLEVEGASFGAMAGGGGQAGSQRGGPDLLELAIESVEDRGLDGLRSAASSDDPAAAEASEEIDDDALIRELLEAWKEAEEEPEDGTRRSVEAASFDAMEVGGGSGEPALDPALALAIHDFASLLAPADDGGNARDASRGLEAASFGGSAPDEAAVLRRLRSDGNSAGSVGAASLGPSREHAFFVTPADLHQSVENLETVGVLNNDA